MNTPKKLRTLTPFEQWVIENKGTEPPFTGQFCDVFSEGIYHCKRCDEPLYKSQDKFSSQCGWPSFDDEITGRVRRIPDPDGLRTEIVCASCDAHLGHVFTGEGFTAKMTRHCVNSISLTLKPNPEQHRRRALFASGCFWGTEYHFAKCNGVLETKVGFAGGHVTAPTYKQVCAGTTGHLECCEIAYNPDQVSFRTLAQLFFETHDFSQEDGHGPDIGPQYLSAVFVETAEEKTCIEELISELKDKGFHVATRILPMHPFWPAEDEHQKYYFHQAKTPYCHIYRKIF